MVAHVDRAFSYGFEDVLGTPQVQRSARRSSSS